MVTKRIIPCLDLKDGRVVKGTNFINLRDAGDPVSVAIEYERQGADEIAFLDISATVEKRATMVNLIERVCDNIFMPITVGGGISSIEDIRLLLMSGADKISINSAAVYNPELIKEAAEKFGSQAIIIAIDARYSEAMGSYEVVVASGKKSTGLDAVEWAQKMVSYGAGEVLLTSMDKDGTKSGYDLKLTSLISDAVRVPIIASGGIGELKDFYDGAVVGKADGLLAASVFHFGTYTVGQVKDYLRERDVLVRDLV